MERRIARFVRGEVLRAARLNEVVDAVNVALASPADRTAATPTSGVPGATLTTWTEVSRSGNTVTFQDAEGNQLALAFAEVETTWTVTDVDTVEEEVEGDGCSVTVTRVTGFTATDGNGNTMIVSGFDV